MLRVSRRNFVKGIAALGTTLFLPEYASAHEPQAQNYLYDSLTEEQAIARARGSLLPCLAGKIQVNAFLLNTLGKQDQGALDQISIGIADTFAFFQRHLPAANISYALNLNEYFVPNDMDPFGLSDIEQSSLVYRAVNSSLLVPFTRSVTMTELIWDYSEQERKKSNSDHSLNIFFYDNRRNGGMRIPGTTYGYADPGPNGLYAGCCLRIDGVNDRQLFAAALVHEILHMAGAEGSDRSEARPRDSRSGICGKPNPNSSLIEVRNGKPIYADSMKQGMMSTPREAYRADILLPSEKEQVGYVFPKGSKTPESLRYTYQKRILRAMKA